MKKLRDKDASKSKKSTSQASKKKFDDSGRSLLPKHSYKNIQPTIEEVSRLNLSFSKDFETCDPTTYASTFDSGNLKRTTDELQQRVDTIAEEFGDFSTIPSQKILIKADFASPVSPDQPLKKRKAVMFKQNNQAVMVDDTSGRDHAVQHVSDLYSETHKDATDKGEIGVSEIQHHHHGEIGVSPQSHQHKSFAEKIAELVTLISKIPTEVIKALKNEENKQSQEEKIDEQQQSQEDGSNKQERPHKEDMQHEDYDKGSLNDMEVSRDESSTFLQSNSCWNFFPLNSCYDVNAANKEAGREDDFENEDYSDLQALEDEVGGTITDSIQAAVDTILFGLSTPSTTKSLDVALKAKAPVKRERKKSRILRSPYISKYDFGSKDAVDFDKEEKMKYAFDGYNINLDLPNELMIDYSQCIAVGLLKTRSAKKETDNHYRVNASGLGYRQLNFVVAHPQSKN
ncbi:uncharacterized protein LOC124897259 [Capsicum annuum]|uniref:uncharacterized protein LOC124897259 n=1 Tax=Capsicum annuum TaxID=4072 RepID=UPI001FB0EFEF|nr:uncharacterized protein LOC124897259 [Capsicum annuum]